MNATSVSGTYLFPSSQRPEVFSIVSGTAIQGIDFVLPAQSEYSVGGRVKLAEPGKRSAVTGPAGGHAGFAVSLQAEPVFARTRVDVGGQPVTGIDVTALPGRTIQFSLQSGTECPASASILIQPLENWGALLHRTIELTTRQELVVKDLAPGRYRLAVSKPADTCCGDDRIVDVRTVEAVSIAIAPGGVVEGKTEAIDGKMPVLTLTTAGTAQLTPPDAEGRSDFLICVRGFIASAREC
jgi:hypothetical protein